jgi:hypothetical protein
VPADVRCTDNSARPDDPRWSQSTGCGDASGGASGLTSSVTSQSRARDRCHRPAATTATIGAAGVEVLKEIHLAADSGYADQAHLIRDFRQFTGATPAAFLAHPQAQTAVPPPT